MDTKKLIIIGIVAIILIAAAIIMLTNTVNYERIDITPNGTSIEVPANQTRYVNDIESIKIWKWNDGVLLTHNSQENGYDIINLTGSGYNAMAELIKNGEMENIDGITCYVINADELLEIHVFDIIKVNYNGKLYCIPLSNETSHDNIMICCKDKDIAVHMAKSVVYKNVYPETNKLDDAKSTIENMTGDLQSKANDYVNNVDLDDAKSAVENITNDLPSSSDAKSAMDQINGYLHSNIPGL